MARFRVRIPYEEPTFAAHQKRPPAPPFVAELEVVAVDEQSARAQALARFEADAKDSGVGWIREPLEDAVTIERI
jgi:hypothetical protein